MMRILLAEDNPVNQTVARELLKRLGHGVDVVDNGAKAVEAASSGSYDIVLMDLHMPVMDGLEAARRIVAGTGTRPRIIAVTANAAPGIREECLQAGMDDYMIKPITLAGLRTVLERWAQAAEIASPGEDSPRSDEGRAGSALARHLEELISETDPEFVQELIGLFVQNGAVLLEEMVRAHEASDWESLERAAHSLKGASNNIGAEDLGGLCLRLERSAVNHEGTMEQVGEIRKMFLSTETELQAFGGKQ